MPNLTSSSTNPPKTGWLLRGLRSPTSHHPRQPPNVLLRLVGFVLVGKHYVDPVSLARPQPLHRQPPYYLVDLQSVT
jgi:hypothetical protein